MRPLKKSAALAATLALVLSLFPIMPASAALLPSPPASVQLNDVEFIDANNGWAVGGFMSSADGKDYAVVMHTANGGQTWTRETVLGQPSSHYFTDIDMVSATTGYALDSASDDRVFRTTDGGATWEILQLTYDYDLAGNVLESVKFFDANNGVVAGYQKSGRKLGVVWRTVDGGDTWTRSAEVGQIVEDPDPEATGEIQSNTLRSVAGYNTSNLLVVGHEAASYAALAYRYNGTTWATQTVAATLASTRLNAVSFPDATHAMAVGASGRAMTFNGTTWTAQTTGIASEIEDVQLLDANNGWIVGDAGAIRKWNGTSFAAQPSGTPYRIRAVHFRDANNGWAVGGGPDPVNASITREVMLKTTNGGATWTAPGAGPSDTTAPTTGISTLPSGWSKANVGFRLTGSDTGGSGLAATYYTLNNGPLQTYTANTTVTVSAEGTTTIDYWSTDVAGNAETPKTATVRIDKTLPATGISGLPTGWSTANVGFRLSGSDSGGSGLAGTSYKLNNGPSQPYTPNTTVTVSAEGTTTIGYWSTDNAGNAEAVKTATVRIDKTAPVSTVTTVGVSISISVSDVISGKQDVFYRIGDVGGYTKYTAPVTQDAGPKKVWSYATDNAGNQETAHATNVVIPDAPPVFTAESVEGAGRYETAVAASKKAFPVDGSASTVIIAYGRNFPDALGGAALAGAVDGPLLLTETNTLPTVIRDEIVRLGAKRAIILGSESVVSPAVAAQVAAALGAPKTVSRVAGAGRYETAAAVATMTPVEENMGTTRDEVFLAVGDNFPDALAASPVAFARKAPILLTRRDALPAATITALKTLQPTKIHILGSEGAVPLAIENAVKANVPSANVDRWAGAGRYATAADIATKSGLGWDGLAIATGENFPDALAGGVMAGKLNKVVLLTPTASLHPDTAAQLKRGQIFTVRYLGSTSAVSQAVRDAVAALLQ